MEGEGDREQAPVAEEEDMRDEEGQATMRVDDWVCEGRAVELKRMASGVEDQWEDDPGHAPCGGGCSRATWSQYLLLFFLLPLASTATQPWTYSDTERADLLETRPPHSTRLFA